MDALTSQDQQALLARVAAARGKLDDLVHDLRAVDRELDDLATERRQHRLLHDVCGALEELSEIGGAGLFWGERTGPATSDDHIRRVRSRVDVFEKHMSEIEERRQAVFEELERQAENTDLLENDLLEAEEEAERLDQEWVVEREIDVLSSGALIMPWTRGGEEDRRYRQSLALSVLYSLLFALVVPLVELPLRALEAEPIEVPEHVVRLMMKARPLPPATRREAIPQVPEESPLLAEAPPKEATQPHEGPTEGSGEGPAAGPGKGLLAFREKLALATNQPLARLGAQARITNAGPATGVVERAMVTSLAPGSSGGINLAALSRGVNAGGSGGGELAGVQVARVASSIGGDGTGHAGGGNGKGTGGGPGLGRTDEEIQIVFDRHKSGLYRLYNRELRSDPTLKGQMVLRMRIEPDGSVSLCELQGTDMKAPQLVAQVVERVKTFDFGAKEGISAVTILYPIDFLPAT